MNQEGVLKTVDHKVLILKKLQSFILKETHNTPLEGKKSKKITLFKVKDNFSWPRMSQLMIKY